MNSPIDERVSTNEIGDETFSLTGHEPEDVISARNLSTSVTSENVARHIKQLLTRPTL